MQPTKAGNIGIWNLPSPKKAAEIVAKYKIVDSRIKYALFRNRGRKNAIHESMANAITTV
jgi:hypothetical protein